MKKIYYLYFNMLIIITFLFTGCMTYGDLTESSYNGKSSEYGEPDRFYLFYLEDQVTFDYEPLGQVNTTSNRTDSDTEVLERMAYEAWSRGANAIIAIQTSTKERTEGTFDLLLNSDCDDEEEVEESTEIYYEALVLQGEAVYIHITDDFLAQYGDGIDLNYVQAVEQDLKRENTSKGAQAILTLAGGLVSLVALIVGSDEGGD